MVGRACRGWRRLGPAKPDYLDGIPSEEEKCTAEEQAVACAGLHKENPLATERDRFGGLFEKEGGVQQYLKVR